MTDGKLVYYSVNFKKVEATAGRPNVVDDSLDLDICDKCNAAIFTIIKEINIKNNAKIKSKK